MDEQTITDRMLSQEVIHRQALEVFIKGIAARLDKVRDWDEFEAVLADVTPVAQAGLPRKLWWPMALEHWQRTQP